MTTFCVAQLAPAPELLAADGVLRAADLGTIADAQVLAARVAAAAEEERAILLATAAEEARQALAADQARVLAEGGALLDGLRQAADSLGERAEDIVTALARQLFERLVLETTPEQRVAASYRRLLAEAPPKLVNAVLRLHPDDLALAGSWEWPVKADPTLARGACRLEADSGQWHADFGAAASALAAALGEPNGR
ncbi:FliH/SctL family protein [[Empedobacter] haloabium]|uniref:FliH/SctL family protein n=1 Tax=[Empedobacter] haloabium TaxID=592317 RepID=A0ABZ1ULM8_9BURK